MTDQLALLVLIGSSTLLSVAFAWLLDRRKPDWRIRKIALIAALPLPSIIIGLCLLLFFHAAFSSKESCGVDACGMAMGFSMIIIFCTLAAYLIAACVGFAVIKIRRK